LSEAKNSFTEKLYSNDSWLTERTRRKNRRSQTCRAKFVWSAIAPLSGARNGLTAGMTWNIAAIAAVAVALRRLPVKIEEYSLNR